MSADDFIAFLSDSDGASSGESQVFERDMSPTKLWERLTTGVGEQARALLISGPSGARDELIQYISSIEAPTEDGEVDALRQALTECEENATQADADFDEERMQLKWQLRLAEDWQAHCRHAQANLQVVNLEVTRLRDLLHAHIEEYQRQKDEHHEWYVCRLKKSVRDARRKSTAAQRAAMASANPAPHHPRAPRRPQASRVPANLTPTRVQPLRGCKHSRAVS
ncbi:MAG: hypothetical protein M1838_005926 [Thelocarpon superellum]|nr:MAG: hypothetical protein M1838_005926 [Thelocarpon superellum]